FKRKSRVFYSQIPHLTRKSRVFPREFRIYAKNTHFLFSNPPFKQKSRLFSSQIPQLCKNHAFSLRKSPI
ncbi:hypothetical protein CP10139811_1312, partial [Chlamydia ibidis]